MKTMNAWVLSMMMQMIMRRGREWGERGLGRALRERNHVYLVFSWSRSLRGDVGEGGG